MEDHRHSREWVVRRIRGGEGRRMIGEDHLHGLETGEGNPEKKVEEEDHHEGGWELGRCWEGGCAQTSR